MSKTSDLFSTYYKYKKINEKNPIIFIHGLGLNHEIWDQQIDFFKNYSTIVYDLIGHGKTPLKKKQINMKDFSTQLLKLINELNLNKIHLVGFSLGSLIARDFASQHSDKLNSLTIFGTVYKRSEDEKRIVINRYETMKKNKDVSKKRSLVRWFTEEFIKKNPLIYKKIYGMLENNKHDNWIKVYKLFAHYEDDDANIKKIKTKSLIITGENDIGSKPRMSKSLSEIISGSNVKLIKNGKHLCNIECAENFNITLKEFIDNNDQA
jgi:(E)-2-((N-methylformamido)methylene)succinate hydrolase